MRVLSAESADAGFFHLVPACNHEVPALYAAAASTYSHSHHVLHRVSLGVFMAQP